MSTAFLLLALTLTCHHGDGPEAACRKRAAQIAALPAAPTVTARRTAARYVTSYPTSPTDPEARARFEWACEVLGHPLLSPGGRHAAP